MSRLTYFSFAIISLAAGWMLFLCTPAGLGLTNDSAAYIGGARSILAGSGYSDIWLDSPREAITHYPPLLSLTLSGLGLPGIDPYRGARLLNIFLFAANTGLMGLLGWRMTKSPWASILLALLFAANAQLLKIHAYVLSEPLFLFLSLLAFLFFDLGAENHTSQRTDYWLLLTGFLSGLAVLTRYSGLALNAAFLLAILLLAPGWRARLIKSAQFLAGAIPPIAAWFIRNTLAAGNAANRIFQYHPIQDKTIRIGLYNLAEFLAPIDAWRDWLFKSNTITWTLTAAGMIVLGWLAVQAWRTFFKQAPSSVLAFTTAIYVFGYLGAVLFSMSFFDASTKFQPRILAPLYVSWMVLLVAVLQFWAAKTQRHENSFLKTFVFLMPFAIGIFVLGLSTFNIQRTSTDLRSAGQGYASWKWRDSLVMADLKNLPPQVAIYTNSPPAVYLVLGRASRVLPTRIDPVDKRLRGDYQQNLEQMRADLLSGRAVLALFDTSNIEDALGVNNLDDFSTGLKILDKAQGDILYGKP